MCMCTRSSDSFPLPHHQCPTARNALVVSKNHPRTHLLTHAPLCHHTRGNGSGLFQVTAGTYHTIQAPQKQTAIGTNCQQPAEQGQQCTNLQQKLHDTIKCLCGGLYCTTVGPTTSPIPSTGIPLSTKAKVQRNKYRKLAYKSRG